MYEQIKALNINYKIETVTNIEKENNIFLVKTNKETYENMIIARIKEDEEFKNLIKENYFKEIQ